MQLSIKDCSCSYFFPLFLLSFKVFHFNENSVGVFVVSGGGWVQWLELGILANWRAILSPPSCLLASYWLHAETASGGSESGVGGARQCIKNQVSVPFTLQCSTVL